jgi:hypothetical protein
MLDVWSRVTICFPEKQQWMAVDMLKVCTEGQHFHILASLLVFNTTRSLISASSDLRSLALCTSAGAADAVH